MAWTSVANPARAPRGMVKPQRCSICGEVVPMQATARHDRENHPKPGRNALTGSERL